MVSNFLLILRFFWLGLLLSASLFTIKNSDIQFDFLGLLPESKTDEMRQVKSFMDNADFSKQVVILLGHKNQKIARESLINLQYFIDQNALTLQENDSQKRQADLKFFFQTLYPYKGYLLSQEDRVLLKNNQGKKIAERALKEITSPFNSFGEVNLQEDLFFLFPRYVLSLTPKNTFKTDDTTGAFYIKKDGKFWYIYLGKVKQDVFSLKVQETLSQTLSPFLSQLPTEVLKMGGVFYAAAGAQDAQQEISLIGGTSACLIILFLLFVFRSFAPLNFSVLIMVSGLMGGASMAFFVYDSLHIIALVFGASLIGVCVDYALHYYCAHLHVKKTTSLSVIKSLMPALPLGVLSSCMGYGLLTFLPFPGIQQMALLGASGLLSAFITVVLWGPVILKKQPETLPLYALKYQNILEKIAGIPLNKKVVTSLTLFFSSVAFLTITFDDNIQNFQSLNPDLKAQEINIQQKMSLPRGQSFFAISAQTLENLLQLEEQITDDLQRTGITFQSLSRLVPSQKRQLENKDLIQNKLLEPFKKSFLKTLGADHLKESQSTAMPLKKISRLPENWQFLFSQKDNKFFGRLVIQSHHDPQDLQRIAKKYPGVSYINPPQEYSTLFTYYRTLMMKMLALVFAVIILLLSVLKGIKSAFKITLPVFLSMVLTISILSFSGVVLTLFHIMGLLLVLCIGMDYALFLYWRQNTPGGRDFFLLANAMAALTTLFSFGTLSLSNTAAVHGFGLSVFVGISLSFLMTTFYLGKK